jgi:hypothetical protein
MEGCNHQVELSRLAPLPCRDPRTVAASILIADDPDLRRDISIRIACE